MSKNSFVSFAELKDKLSGIHDSIDGLEEKISVCKDAININSDGCQELEAQLSDLTKRMDKLERSLRVCQNNVTSVNDHGTAAVVGVVLGVTACIALWSIGKKVDELEARMIKMKAGCPKPKQEETFRSQNECCASESDATEKKGD